MQADYFTLFDLEPVYEVDFSVLAEKYRLLQRLYHPDRVAGKTPQEQRVAVQRASWVNQAYDVLKSPVARAHYLLELRQEAVDSHNYITRDTGFLMAQMALREQLQDLEQQRDPFALLDALSLEAEQQFCLLQQQFSDFFTRERYIQATEIVAKMQFYSKFIQELDDTEAQLDNI